MFELLFGLSAAFWSVSCFLVCELPATGGYRAARATSLPYSILYRDSSRKGLSDHPVTSL